MLSRTPIATISLHPKLKRVHVITSHVFISVPFLEFFFLLTQQYHSSSFYPSAMSTNRRKPDSYSRAHSLIMSQRKSDTFVTMDDYDLDAELENMPMTDSCDTVRYMLPCSSPSYPLSNSHSCATS